MFKFRLAQVLMIIVIASGCNAAPTNTQITALPTQSAITRTAPPTFTPPPTRPVLITTPTVLSVTLPPGAARVQAFATDQAMQPTPRATVQFDPAQAMIPLRFEEFYAGYDIRTGLKFTDKLVALDGKQVVIEGYMAPPLKPALEFFVLTQVRLAFCPFCSTAAEWPNDIAMIYMPEGKEALSTTDPVRVRGRLEVGVNTDLETGMVSLVRIYADAVEIVQ
jgi:hypothetical protein